MQEDRWTGLDLRTPRRRARMRLLEAAAFQQVNPIEASSPAPRARSGPSGTPPEESIQCGPQSRSQP